MANKALVYNVKCYLIRGVNRYTDISYRTQTCRYEYMHAKHIMKTFQTNSKTLICFHLLYEGHDIRVYQGDVSDIINDISLIYSSYISEYFALRAPKYVLVVHLLQC